MNKKIIHLFAASLLIGSVATIDAATNKTFMNPRSVGVNLARQQTIWHKQIHRPKKEDSFGGHLQVTGFYEDATNEDEIGQYFGFNDKNLLSVGTPNPNATPPVCVDIDNRNLIHNPTNDPANTLAGTLDLEFDHHAWGAEISYFQNLDYVWKGLYFLVNLPIAEVEHTHNVTLNEECGCPVNQTITPCGATSSKEVSVLDYFAGNISQGADDRLQAPLKFAKISQCDDSHSESGIADLDFILGWDFYRRDNHHAGINFGVTFPTGSDSDGEFVFEPMLGNGQHWGVGAGLTAGFTPWKTTNQALELFTVVNYRYLFSDEETRTLGINCKNWGQYLLLGKKDQRGVFPAANVLTTKVDVRPGSQVDALIGLSYNWKGLTLDLGYNVYAREHEHVELQDCAPFPANTYGLAGNNYNTTNAFTQQDIAKDPHTISATNVRTGDLSGRFLANSDVDTSVAETPGFATHKLFGGLGYIWKDWEYPLMLKFGGFYEFASESKTLEQWSVFGGLGVSF